MKKIERCNVGKEGVLPEDYVQFRNSILISQEEQKKSK